MSANSNYLFKHGWVITSSKRLGMFKIQRWYHPSFGGGNSQEQALLLQRSQLKYDRRLKQAKATVTAVFGDAGAAQPVPHGLDAKDFVKACFNDDERAKTWVLRDHNMVLARGISELNVWEIAAEAIQKAEAK